MPRTCTVCLHAERAAIDAALLAQQPLRDIARQYRVSKDALARHREHLPAALVHAKAVEDVTHADDLLTQVRDLQARALTILDTAETAGDLKVALAAIREARGCIELFGRLAGELSDGATVNVVLSPEWARLRAVIIGALAPYPDARLAVAARLVEAETGRVPYGQ